MTPSVAAVGGIAGIAARIAGIEARFGARSPATAATAGSAGGGAAGGVLGADTLTPGQRAALGMSGPAFAAGLADASAQLQAAGLPAGAGATGSEVVSIARRYLGVPYVWGGTDPATGLDCSGLTQLVYRQVGVELPRVSADQAKVGTPVAGLAAARPGDLLFFSSPVDHVGIYVGDGKMLHAPRTGKSVEVSSVYETPTAIRRVLPGTGAADVASGPLAALGGALAAGTPYAAEFRRAEAATGVPARVLAAVARAESGFDPSAASPAGARGLMQFMPATAAELGVDPLDPASAIAGAARLLKQHVAEFGSLPLALAAYNAGPGAVRRYGGVPPYAETKSYVASIMSELTGRAV